MDTTHEEELKILGKELMGWTLFGISPITGVFGARWLFYPFEDYGTKFEFFDDKNCIDFIKWNPFENTIQTFGIIDKLIDNGWKVFSLEYDNLYNDGKWKALFYKLGNAVGYGETREEAICFAALETLETIEEESYVFQGYRFWKCCHQNIAFGHFSNCPIVLKKKLELELKKKSNVIDKEGNQ